MMISAILHDLKITNLVHYKKQVAVHSMSEIPKNVVFHNQKLWIIALIPIMYQLLKKQVDLNCQTNYWLNTNLILPVICSSNDKEIIGSQVTNFKEAIDSYKQGKGNPQTYYY